MTEQPQATKPHVVQVALPITVLPAPEGLRAVAIAGRVFAGRTFCDAIGAAQAGEQGTQEQK